MANRLWPTLDSADSCALAIKDGSMAAFIGAGAAATVGTISIITGEPVLGFDGWSYIDAVIFAIIGWRIRAGSFPWTATAIVYWLANLLFMLAEGGRPNLGSFIFLLLYVNAGRAIVARNRLNAAAPTITGPQVN